MKSISSAVYFEPLQEMRTYFNLLTIFSRIMLSNGQISWLSVLMELQRCSDSLLLAPRKFSNQRNAAGTAFHPQRCHPNREFHQK
jgi:hypothetical protein